LPASQVGGDFYDFYDAPGQPFRFSLGDVTGKGISAAMLMAMTRTTFRNRIRNIGNAYPADIMGAANDDMYDDFTELTMFATVFFGQYHHQERAIYYANAGHSPVVYCPFGGPSYLVEADGTALGVLPTSLCENHMMPFQPGDVLVAATDGFVEARNPQGDMFGYDRFLGLIETYAHEDPETLGGILYQAVATFSAGQPQDDDQTLVVVKGVE
jgi:sigma-B regulation protein RsbU (phosphoserine phosphatase)